MKRISTLLCIGLCCLSNAGLFAQSCTPIDPFPPGAFVYPAPYSVANPTGGIADTAFVGVVYETSLHLNIPSSVDFPGFGTIPVNGFFIATEGAISGLPPSMDYVCNPPNCVFNSNTTGCINIFGTAGPFEVAIYNVVITGVLNSILTFPITLPYPGLLDGNYYLHVKGCPINETQETATVCAGDSYTFPDGTEVTNITASTEHISTLLAANGCDSLIYTVVNVTTVDISVSQDGNTLASNAAGSSYQWIDCADGQPIAGETNAVFLPSVTGSYAVIVTTGNCQDTSACFNVTINGVSEGNQRLGIRLSPNPAGNYLRIDLSETVPAAEVKIRDVRGETAFTSHYSDTMGWDMDISQLAPGLYVVSIRTEKGTSVRKFFKS